MIPFNKERALAGDPVVTSESDVTVTQIVWFEDAARFVCSLKRRNGDVHVGDFYADGRLDGGYPHASIRLFMKPKTRHQIITSVDRIVNVRLGKDGHTLHIETEE